MGRLKELARTRETIYRQQVLTVIEVLEKAHLAYSAEDYVSCVTDLDIAESIMPERENDAVRMLRDQLRTLRTRIADAPKFQGLRKPLL